MLFNFYMPTRLISGEGCIKANMSFFPKGGRCFIVTGKKSAVFSGALDDVTFVFDKLGIKYKIFDRIVENPPVSVCHEGGVLCRAFGADFVMGIGGGSPIDAAKAIAAYAANPGIAPMDIYGDGLLPSLPIFAVPTTAGTGSEANQYSVLTIDETNQKRTFTSPHSYPKVAFFDCRYTASLSEDGTLSTALDAFSHCFESFMSPRSNAMMEQLAAAGGRIIWNVLSGGIFANLPAQTREKLLYASCLGGIVIGMTGTGFPHPLGYPLTLEKGVAHGFACAAFCGEYIAYNQKCEAGRARIESFCNALGASPKEVGDRITMLSRNKIRFDKQEINKYAESVMKAKNLANSPYIINYEEIKEIYSRLFG